MFDHHYILAFLPYINYSGVIQEYDCDEPPNEVLLRAFTQRWYLSKAHRKILNMGLYMRLIAFQIEFTARLNRKAFINTCGECIQRVNQARDTAEISYSQR